MKAYERRIFIQLLLETVICVHGIITATCKNRQGKCLHQRARSTLWLNSEVDSCATKKEKMEFFQKFFWEEEDSADDHLERGTVAIASRGIEKPTENDGSISDGLSAKIRGTQGLPGQVAVMENSTFSTALQCSNLQIRDVEYQVVDDIPVLGYEERFEITPDRFSFSRSFSTLAGRVRSFGRSREDPPGIEANLSEESNESSNSHTAGTSTTSSAASEEGPKKELCVAFEDLPVTHLEAGVEACANERSDSKRHRCKVSKHRRRIASYKSSRKNLHFEFCAHGKVWTTFAVLFTWAGFGLSFAGRQSTEFVKLDVPLYVDPTFNSVSEVGMVNLQLCYNETYVGSQSGCIIYQLQASDVNDRMFQVSRSLAFLATVLGGFLSVFVSAASFWQSINLRPIGIGYLIAYFLQSFSFLFFDSHLCAEHSCQMSQGCYLSIVASVCWILTSIVTSRMDLVIEKKRKKLRRRKERHSSSRSRSRSPKKRSKKLSREISDTTAATSTSTATNRSFELIEGIDDIEASQAWIARQEAFQSERRSKSPSKKNLAPSAQDAIIGACLGSCFEGVPNGSGSNASPVLHEHGRTELPKTERRSRSPQKKKRPSATNDPNIEIAVARPRCDRSLERLDQSITSSNRTWREKGFPHPTKSSRRGRFDSFEKEVARPHDGFVDFGGCMKRSTSLERSPHLDVGGSKTRRSSSVKCRASTPEKLTISSRRRGQSPNIHRSGIPKIPGNQRDAPRGRSRRPQSKSRTSRSKSRV